MPTSPAARGLMGGLLFLAMITMMADAAAIAARPARVLLPSTDEKAIFEFDVQTEQHRRVHDCVHW